MVLAIAVPIVNIVANIWRLVFFVYVILPMIFVHYELFCCIDAEGLQLQKCFIC